MPGAGPVEHQVPPPDAPGPALAIVRLKVPPTSADLVRVTDESRKVLAAVCAVVAGFATLFVLQKAFKLTGDSFIGWAIPCIFVGIATYNLIKPSESSPS